ncbi:MAG TPA: prolyl oligopeptidase family serine peptidase [Draconibacterium sp.]|nr:prolyl oligopeptidase family serine peptidase [Draconibacterium sp.]
MKKLTLFTFLLLFVTLLNAQNSKRPLTLDDILKWNRITETHISNNGEYIVYKEEPWQGDPVMKITTPDAVEQGSFLGGIDATITSDSRFVVFKLEAPVDTVRALKLKGIKKDDLPQNQLIIFNLEQTSTDTISNLQSLKVPEKWNGWIFYQLNEENKKNDDKNGKDKKKVFPLFVHNLNTGESIRVPAVTEYEIAEEGSVLAFASEGDSLFDAGVYLYELQNNKQLEVLNGKGKFAQLTLNKPGSQFAFLADTSQAKEAEYSVYYWSGEGTAAMIMDNSNSSLPENWEISENGKLNFSNNGESLFFGSAPQKTPKDTTILEEEIPVLDVWSWDEEILHTVQLNNKNRDEKKTYLAVINLKDRKAVQLETEQFTNISLINKGDAAQVLATSNRPYAVQSMWEGNPVHNDFYLVDINTGKATMFKQDCRAQPMTSPAGKYVYWYNAIDTSWNTYELSSGKEFKITSPQLVKVADELNDVPNLPDSYRFAGWLTNDDAFLVYDRYDLWKVDPTNSVKPENLTSNGRENRISYRLVRFNAERGEGINPEEQVLLKGFNEQTKADSYFLFDLRNPGKKKIVLDGNFKLNTPIKAKEADLVIYTKENFQTYPNLLASNLKFKNPVQLSDAAPQQNEFLWGTAELVSWRSLDGMVLEGTLHKPANFDPTQKYPMIVNFYEKSSDALLSYRMPENNRSTIDYHYYTGNGYIVFNPDIYYKEGYPGESAFNCVMPGVTYLIEKGFVDADHIGAQGHSWGGYQVAYLATRTNIFAAIESGAPVVNMFSAYGEIRWGTGLNRSFQYEHAQSRIGKSIWEAPLRYLENSPIFTLDKIQTPILIMHNDDDGAVPWYQGIEFFIGMRRLGKPAWLLNYNEADHWPLKVRDKHDFQIRLSQFFDHYLKGAPEPKWMSEGVPATKKGIEMGYEMEEK